LGSLSGSVTADNDFNWNGAVTNGLSVADAAGEASVTCPGYVTYTNFASVTNSISSYTANVNGGYILSGGGSWDSLTVTGTGTHDQYDYGTFVLSWSNIYVVGTGVTSLSASDSILGIATGSITCNDPYAGGMFLGLSSGVNMNGTVTVQLQYE